MSGPKYYNFPMTSAEEAAGVFAQLSSFQLGVQIKVVNNEIQFTVSNNAWCAGANYTAISEKISVAKRRFDESQEIQRILEKRRGDETQKIKNKKKELECAYNTEKSSIANILWRCNQLDSLSQTQVETPFGIYALSGENQAVKALSDRAKDRLKQLETEYIAAIKKCDESLWENEKCKTMRDLSSVQRKYNALKITPSSFELEATNLHNTITAKTARLKEFVGFLQELYRNMQDQDLRGYYDRIKAEVSEIDIFAEKADEKIKAILSRIEAEIRELKMREEAHRQNDEIRRKVSAQIDALNVVTESLRPVVEVMDSTRVVETDCSQISKECLDECEGLFASIEALEFISGEHRGRLDNLKSNMGSLKNSTMSAGTVDRLAEIKRELVELEKAGKRDEDIYKRFKAEQEKYYELYLRLQGIMCGDAVECSTDASEVLVNPTDIFLVYRNPEEQIAHLKKLNEQLATGTMSVFQESVCNAIAAAVDQNENGKTFKKERGADGAIHTTFVRKKNKGAIFDIACSKEGQIGAYPRGVILSNGKPTISPEELRDIHNSCSWSKEVSDSLQSLGISDLVYQEMSEEVRNAMYSDENYYHIETIEDSVRYLYISYYTLDEIADKMDISLQTVKDLLEIKDEASGGKDSPRRKIDTYTHIAIDPKKR